MTFKLQGLQSLIARTSSRKQQQVQPADGRSSTPVFHPYDDKDAASECNPSAELASLTADPSELDPTQNIIVNDVSLITASTEPNESGLPSPNPENDLYPSQIRSTRVENADYSVKSLCSRCQNLNLESHVTGTLKSKAAGVKVARIRKDSLVDGCNMCTQFRQFFN